MTTSPAARVFTSLLLLMGGQAEAFQRSPPGCVEWRACREMALAAETAREYEAFHDLAWRAVQTGPPRDPALLYLVARAQARSGRPHDALVMLERIADSGVAAEAATDEAFSRTRELPGWPAIAERLERPVPNTSSRPAAPKPTGGAKPGEAANATRVPGREPATTSLKGLPGTPVRPTVPNPAAVTAPPALKGAPAPAGLAAVPVAVTEAARLSAPPFAIAGVAYDSVSDRFVLGDRAGRKLVVVGNVSNGGGGAPVDLVRADSAGFKDISALEIDAQRGDLWVTSGEASGAGVLHRVQLVSGRPLRTYSGPGSSALGELVDLAVMNDGEILVLDATKGSLLHLRPRGTTLEPLLRIDGSRATSVSAGDGEGVAYVSQGDALFRVDVSARRSTALELPRGVALKGVERIRFYRSALIALVRDESGSAAIVRLDLNARGTAVTRATKLDVAVPPGAGSSFSIAGNDLLFAVQAGSELTVYRVRLRN
jgi:hypothetical protein